MVVFGAAAQEAYYLRCIRRKKEAKMNREEQEDTTVYKVVVNHEEQYSIWPADRENPLGWRDAGKSGLKEECLAYIKEVWTDMRPLSLRKKMEEAERQRQSQEATGG
jgi:MbtH protein